MKSVTREDMSARPTFTPPVVTLFEFSPLDDVITTSAIELPRDPLNEP